MPSRVSWRRRWPADLLVLFVGCMLPLAYAPLAWWPLALASIALFVFSVQPVDGMRAFWRGYLFGIGWFGVGVSWVFVSIRLFGNAGTGLSLTITTLLILVLSFYPAFSVWIAKRTTFGKRPLGFAMMFSASFVFLEWLRGWLFTGFGWLEPGYAFIDTPLAMLAPITGVLGITFVVILSASLLTSIVEKESTLSNRITAVVVIAGLWGGCGYFGMTHFTKPTGDDLKVALIQGNIPQHRKWKPDMRQPTLQMYRQYTEQHWDKDIVIWPETAIPAFEDQVMTYLDTMHSAAQISGTSLLTGIVVRESHGNRYFNALITLGNANRAESSLYTKQHLVPFGEYLPFKAILDPLLGFLEIPMSDFSAGGQHKPLVEVGSYQAGVSICFEDAFGEEVRSALPEAHYLVNISNDAWFGNSLAPHQHLQIARMRALETGRYLLRGTNTGITAIIGPDGAIQQQANQFQREALAGTIRAMQGVTPYAKFGHYPVLAVSIMFLLIGGWLKRRSRNS